MRADALAKQIEEALPAQQQQLNPRLHEEATVLTTGECPTPYNLLDDAYCTAAEEDRRKGGEA